jgi:hypothetical protein
MNRLLIVLFCLLLSFTVQSQDPKLYPVFLQARNNKVAFIDTTGTIKITVDSTYQLQDFGSLDLNIFKSGKCILRSAGMRSTDNQYFLLNRKGIVEGRFDPGLWPARIAGKFIVVTNRYDKTALYDLNMKQLTPFQYQSSIIEFSEGVAFVEKNDSVGWIDEQLKESIFKFPKKTYDTTERYRMAKEIYFNQFHEGLAQFSEGGKIGYMDKQQKIVIPAKYDYAEAFSEGLAYVSLENSTGGYIDHSGKWIIGPGKDLFYGSFHNRLLPFKDEKTGLYGYINQKGKFAITPRYKEASQFKRGYAYVLTPGRKDGYRQIINTKGDVLYEDFFKFASFDDEHLAVIVQDGKFAGFYYTSNNFYYTNYQFKPIYKPACAHRIITTTEVLKGCKAEDVHDLFMTEDNLVHLDSLIPHLDSINPKYIWLRAKNKIRTFPVQIGTMTNLEELTLAFNEIETIPASIGQLKNLKKLNLQFNKIKTLPPELYTLTQLQEINLQNNLLDMKAILELKKHLPNTKIIIKDND